MKRVFILIILLNSFLFSKWDYRYLICKVGKKKRLITSGFVEKDGYYYFKKYIGKDELVPIIVITWLSKRRCKVINISPKVPKLWEILAGE